MHSQQMGAAAGQPRSLGLLSQAFAQSSQRQAAGCHSPGVKLHRSSGKDVRCSLPIAAEIQAILKGHIDGSPPPFGTSPPPRVMDNAIVRDSSFSTMRMDAQAASGSSCSTAFYQAEASHPSSLSCISPASAMSSA